MVLFEEKFALLCHTCNIRVYLQLSLDVPAIAYNCLSVSAEYQDGLSKSDEFNFDVRQGWRLSLNEECNIVIRDDFLYEQVSVTSRRLFYANKCMAADSLIKRPLRFIFQFLITGWLFAMGCLRRSQCVFTARLTN